MQDKLRATAGIISTLGMLVTPVVAFLIGWQVWDINRGILLALIAFGVFFLLSAVLFKGIRNPSVFLSVIPFVLSMVYGASPVDVPIPVDATVVQFGGSLLSYMMLKKSNPDLPAWTLFALLGASVYDLFGFALPGPIDELLVDALALYGITRANRKREVPPRQLPGN